MKKSSRRSKLRPTSSMVKQAVFNMLGDIEGKLFIDLFAGSGQMGFMAMERGAKVIFVEKNRKLAQLIKEKGGNAKVSDAIKFLESFESSPDIIFADPPYDYQNYKKLIEVALKKLSKGGIFILEHRKNQNFEAEKVKTYGDTALSIWRKEDDECGLSGDL
ncbi:RsmD family RNA methyltransferase [Thermocrinis sp.]|uniref:RsmD family RNA methyltransferase n=1 Tax=Thermocrinis sp. TaxID=2024383 RepID=UPI002FDE00F6